MIKEYAIYLKDTLFKINGSYGDVYNRLNTFVETGKVKDIIYTNLNLSTKEILNIMSENIRHFFSSQGSTVPILSYEEFISDERNKKIEDILN